MVDISIVNGIINQLITGGGTILQLVESVLHFFAVETIHPELSFHDILVGFSLDPSIGLL